MGNIIELIPKTKPIFAIFDPTTFPIAIPEYPSRVAFKLTTNSGKDVPNATIVNPTTKCGILNCDAICTPLLTIHSAPM